VRPLAGWLPNALANGRAVVFNPEPEFSPLMFVQHRRQRDNPRFQLTGGFLQFDNFRFGQLHLLPSQCY
jgi:hypothetical protein